MINGQLLGYIRQQLSLKTPRDVITNNLRSTGWNELDIKQAFDAVIPPSVATPINPPQPIVNPVATTPIQPIQANQNPQPKVNNISQFQNELSQSMNPAVQNTPNIVGNTPTQPVVHKSHILRYVVSAFFVLLLGAGAIYAYTNDYFTNTKTVFSKMVTNLYDSQSAKFDISFSMRQESKLGEDSNAMLANSNNESFEFKTNGVYDFNNNTFKYSASNSIAMSGIEVNFSMRVLDKVLYLRLDKISDLGFSDLSELKNKWFSVDIGDAKTTPDEVVPFVGSSAEALDSITPAEKERLTEITRSFVFIKVLDKYGTDVVGIDRYSFELDREGINNYLWNLKEFLGSLSVQDPSFEYFNPAEINKELDKIKDFRGDIEVGRKDYMPYMVSISFTRDVDLPYISFIGDMNDSPAPQGIQYFDLYISFSDWNKVINVEKPLDFSNFKSFIQESFRKEQLMVEVAGIKAYMSSMRISAELYYDDNYPNGGYYKFCSGGDIKKAQTAIADYNGLDFACKDSKNAYASSVKLPDNSGYWCIDSTGSSKNVSRGITSTVCPTK